MKRPAFQFYPADWRKDVELQSCSITARGVWHELLCVMHECKPYGHLVLPGGLSMNEPQAARLIGVDIREYRTALAELEAVTVFSRKDDGTIYSRRMVRDEALRNVRALAGSKGGNPALVGGKDKQAASKEVGAEVNQTGKQILTPSSSSSSSSTSVVQNPGIDARTDPNNAFLKEGRSKTERWDASDQGIDAKGRELGIPATPGESYFDYKRRLWSVINERTRAAD